MSLSFLLARNANQQVQSTLFYFHFFFLSSTLALERSQVPLEGDSLDSPWKYLLRAMLVLCWT